MKHLQTFERYFDNNDPIGAEPTYDIAYEFGKPKSIHCKECGMTSHNPGDVAHRYCANCDKFHDDNVLEPVSNLEDEEDESFVDRRDYLDILDDETLNRREKFEKLSVALSEKTDLEPDAIVDLCTDWLDGEEDEETKVGPADFVQEFVPPVTGNEAH